GLDFALDEDMKPRIMLFAALAILAACSKQEAKEKTQKVAQKVQDAFDVSAPMGKPEPPDAAQQRERERFDQQWRALQSFRAQQAAAQQRAAQAAAAAQPQLNFVSGKEETFKRLDVNAINAAPVH